MGSYPTMSWYAPLWAKQFQIPKMNGSMNELFDFVALPSLSNGEFLENGLAKTTGDGSPPVTAGQHGQVVEPLPMSRFMSLCINQQYEGFAGGRRDGQSPAGDTDAVVPPTLTRSANYENGDEQYITQRCSLMAPNVGLATSFSDSNNASWSITSPFNDGGSTSRILSVPSGSVTPWQIQQCGSYAYPTNETVRNDTESVSLTSLLDESEDVIQNFGFEEAQQDGFEHSFEEYLATSPLIPNYRPDGPPYQSINTSDTYPAGNQIKGGNNMVQNTSNNFVSQESSRSIIDHAMSKETNGPTQPKWNQGWSSSSGGLNASQLAGNSSKPNCSAYAGISSNGLYTPIHHLPYYFSYCKGGNESRWLEGKGQEQSMDCFFTGTKSKEVDVSPYSYSATNHNTTGYTRDAVSLNGNVGHCLISYPKHNLGRLQTTGSLSESSSDGSDISSKVINGCTNNGSGARPFCNSMQITIRPFEQGPPTHDFTWVTENPTLGHGSNSRTKGAIYSTQQGSVKDASIAVCNYKNVLRATYNHDRLDIRDIRHYVLFRSVRYDYPKSDNHPTVSWEHDQQAKTITWYVNKAQSSYSRLLRETLSGKKFSRRDTIGKSGQFPAYHFFLVIDVQGRELYTPMVVIASKVRFGEKGIYWRPDHPDCVMGSTNNPSLSPDGQYFTTGANVPKAKRFKLHRKKTEENGVVHTPTFCGISTDSERSIIRCDRVRTGRG